MDRDTLGEAQVGATGGIDHLDFYWQVAAGDRLHDCSSAVNVA